MPGIIVVQPNPPPPLTRTDLYRKQSFRTISQVSFSSEFTATKITARKTRFYLPSLSANENLCIYSLIDLKKHLTIAYIITI